MGRLELAGDWTGRRMTRNQLRHTGAAAERDKTMVRTTASLWRVALATLFAAALGISVTTGSVGAAETASLQITVTDGGYAVQPEIAAGQYQVTIENLSGQRVDLVLVRVPDGISTAEMQAVFVSDTGKLGCGLIELSTLESAQPTNVISLGQAAPHSQGKTVVSLESGTWVVMSGNPGAYSTFAEFSVG